MIAPTTIIKTITKTKTPTKTKNKAKKAKKKPQTRAVKKHKRDKKEHMKAHQQNVDQKVHLLDPLTQSLLYKPGESTSDYFKRIGVKSVQHSTDTVKYSIKDSLFRNASYNTQKKLSYADKLINDFIVKNEGELCVSVRNNAKNSNTDVTAERTRSHLNILGARCDVVKTNAYIGDDSTPAYYLNKNKSLNINVHQPTQCIVKALQEVDGLSLRSLESAADFEFDSKDKEYCTAAKKALTLFFVMRAVLNMNKFSPALNSENSKRSAFSYAITNPYNVEIFLHETVVKTEDGEEIYSVYTVFKDSKGKVVCRIYSGSDSRPEDWNKLRVEIVIPKDKAEYMGIDINTDLSSLYLSPLDFFTFIRPMDSEFKEKAVNVIMEKGLTPSLKRECEKNPHTKRQVRRSVYKDLDTINSEDTVHNQIKDFFDILNNTSDPFTLNTKNTQTKKSYVRKGSKVRSTKNIIRDAKDAAKDIAAFQNYQERHAETKIIDKDGVRTRVKVYKNKYNMKYKDREKLVSSLFMDFEFLEDISVFEQRHRLYENKFESQFKYIQEKEDQGECLVMYKVGDEGFIPYNVTYFTNTDNYVSIIKKIEESVNAISAADLDKIRKRDRLILSRGRYMGKYAKIRSLKRAINDLSNNVGTSVGMCPVTIDHLCSYTSWQLYNYCLVDSNKAALVQLVYLWHTLRNTILGISCNRIREIKLSRNALESNSSDSSSDSLDAKTSKKLQSA